MILLIKQLESMKINVVIYLRVNIFVLCDERKFFNKVIFIFDRGLIGHYYIIPNINLCNVDVMIITK